MVAAISLAGGALLLWMGVRLVMRPGRHLPEVGDEGGAAAGVQRTMIGGVLISLANPFWTIWWATIGLGFLAWARESGETGVGAFYAGHVLSDLAWYTFVAVAVSSGGRVMGPRLYRGLLMACGLFLLGLGAWFLVVGVQHLRAVAA